MKRPLVLALVAVILVAGCRRRSKPSSVSPGEVPAAAMPGAVSPESDAPKAAVSLRGELDPAVRGAVQKFVAAKGVAPRSWIDLTVEQGYLDSVPVGRDGKPLDFERTMAQLGVELVQ